MAVRYLSIEEAAQKLGRTVDEVHRLVDQRKLYPVRDAGMLKFKDDDLDRFLTEAAEEAPTREDEAVQAVATDLDSLDGSPLELEPLELEPIDLDHTDSPPPVAAGSVSVPPSGIDAADMTVDDSLALDIDMADDLDASLEKEATPAPIIASSPSDIGVADSLAIAEPLSGLGSEVIAIADESPPGDGSMISALSAVVVPEAGAGDSAAQVVLGESGAMALDRDDLEIESIIEASAASMAVDIQPPAEGTLDIDLGAPLADDDAAQSLAIGSGNDLAIGSGNDLALGSNPKSGKVGSALSDVLDSGVLIEEKAVTFEGVVAWDEVDLGIEEDKAAEGEGDLGEGLGEGGGEDVPFDLGGEGGVDDESASVLNPTDESEESSLFASGGESSGFSEQSFNASGAASASFDMPGEMAADIRFSTWQIVGLVCCSLVLLIGGLVAFDLVRTIGTPRGTVLANPLLEVLAKTFGWRGA